MAEHRRTSPSGLVDLSGRAGRQPCTVPHCQSPANESGRCWSHRGGKLRRKTALARVNRKRRTKLFTRNYGSATRLHAAKAEGCLVAGRAGHRCSGPLDAAHVVARGMGGAKGDARQIVILCRAAHIQAGERGTSDRALFETVYGVDLEREAAKLAARLDEGGGA